MQKYLITGFSGFVSRHFLDLLERIGEKTYVYGIDIVEPDFDIHSYKTVDCKFQKLDLLNKVEVDNVIFQFQPTYILHLASFSSVAFSWKNPVASFANNTNIFLNLLEQVRSLNLKCRILSIGSSEEYGDVNGAEMPLREDHILKPVSPYAVARVSQEMLSKIYVDGFGMDIILTRSFNHIGPGQREVFVISSFVKKILEIKKSDIEPLITTGNLNIIRDFLDVRDVVKAYYELFKKGEKGEVYNICSGKGIALKEIIKKISSLLNFKIDTVTDPMLVRPSDNSVIIGDNKKICKTTGWYPSISLEQSLSDVIEYWDEKI